MEKLNAYGMNVAIPQLYCYIYADQQLRNRCLVLRTHPFICREQRYQNATPSLLNANKGKKLSIITSSIMVQALHINIYDYI